MNNKQIFLEESGSLGEQAYKDYVEYLIYGEEC